MEDKLVQVLAQLAQTQAEHAKAQAETNQALQVMTSMYEQMVDLVKQLKVEKQEQESEDRLILPLTQAWKLLGYAKESQLRYRVDTGYYRLGIEVEDRRPQNSQRPSYYMRIGACRQRDAENPARRAS